MITTDDLQPQAVAYEAAHRFDPEFIGVAISGCCDPPAIYAYYSTQEAADKAQTAHTPGPVAFRFRLLPGVPPARASKKGQST